MSVLSPITALASANRAKRQLRERWAALKQLCGLSKAGGLLRRSVGSQLGTRRAASAHAVERVGIARRARLARLDAAPGAQARKLRAQGQRGAALRLRARARLRRMVPLATLLVMTLSLEVALDNALLAVLSVGVPIGLGVYWAWLHRDWTDRDRRIGFAAAA